MKRFLPLILMSVLVIPAALVAKEQQTKAQQEFAYNGEFELKRILSNNSSYAVFSPVGSKIVSYTYDTYEEIKILDARSGECLHTLTRWPKDCTPVALTPDGSLLILYAHDRIKIWDTHADECVRTLTGHTDRILSVVLNHDGSLIASASEDGTVKIWDIHTGLCKRILKETIRGCDSIVFSHDSTVIGCVKADNTITLWDVKTGLCLQELSRACSTDIYSVSLNHNGSLIALGFKDGIIEIVNTQTEKCVRTLKGDQNGIVSVEFNHDGSQILSACMYNTAKIWDVATGDCLQTLPGDLLEAGLAKFNQDSSLIVSSTFGTIKIWERTPRQHSTGAYYFKAAAATVCVTAALCSIPKLFS